MSASSRKSVSITCSFGGENGPKHADAWVEFSEVDGGTEVTLGMAMATAKEWAEAKGFGAEALGLQTLGKLARFIGAD